MASDALDWLFSLEQFGIKLGLDNISALVEGLGHPEQAFRSVHVAGTNGKGSVTAMVDAAFRCAGLRSARYTSPHLVDLAERFVIGGRPVSHDTLIDVAADLQRLVARLRASGRLEQPPTFFEVTTAAAFEIFRRAGVDVAVCEVGLGGRLDATNVLTPLVTAITSIGLDHQEHLGGSIEEIAAEKAGIIKPGTPVIVGRVPADARAVIGRVTRREGSELIDAWDGVTAAAVAESGGEASSARAADHGTAVDLRTPRRAYGVVRLALAGVHQIENAVVATRVLEAADARGCPVPARAVPAGLAQVVWPGRLEQRRLPDGREVLLDAAHNPDGAAALAAYLSRDPRAVRPPLVFAAMRDKDATGMLRALVPAIGALVATRPSSARATDPLELAARATALAPHLPVEVAPLARDALAVAWRRSPRIVVAGSIYLLGEVMKELGGS